MQAASLLFFFTTLGTSDTWDAPKFITLRLNTQFELQAVFFDFGVKGSQANAQ